MQINRLRVLKILGFLIVLLSGFLILPGLVALYYNEATYAIFFYTASGSLILGGLLAKIKPKETKINFRDSILVVSLGWIVFSLIGAIPFIFYSPLNFTQAVFETMSGFTTTGASVLNDIEALDHSLLFWRSFTHWLGGMGIIVLSLAIMPLLGSSGSNIYKAEVTGPTSDKIAPKLQNIAKLLWYVYAGLTILQIIVLYIAGMGWFDATCHAFGTLATGGFSTKNASVAAYDSSTIHWIITFFMLLAGANFALHIRAISGNIGYLFRDIEFRTYFFIFSLTSLTIGGVLYYTDPTTPFAIYIRDSAFQVISILTTTGFVSADYSIWPFFTQFLIFGMMLIGGCGGSTGGGIKVIRVIILVKSSIAELRKFLHPQAVMQSKVGGNPVKEDVQLNVNGFFILYVLTVIVTGGLLAATGLDLGTSLSAALSSVGNIGPGFAGVGPVSNFAGISDAGLWILSIAMLAGRLEMYTVILLFSTNFWRGR
ncbi:MAG: TrkH family potassium uptake protein [Fibrobacterales bacterium]